MWFADDQGQHAAVEHHHSQPDRDGLTTGVYILPTNYIYPLNIAFFLFSGPGSRIIILRLRLLISFPLRLQLLFFILQVDSAPTSFTVSGSQYWLSLEKYFSPSKL